MNNSPCYLQMDNSGHMAWSWQLLGSKGKVDCSQGVQGGTSTVRASESKQNVPSMSQYLGQSSQNEQLPAD